MSIFNKSLLRKFITSAEFLKRNKMTLPFNKQILSIRKFLGMSQANLSKRTNISQAFIAKVESGRQNLSLLQLERIVNGLDCDLQIQITPRKSLDKIKQDRINLKVKQLVDQTVSNMTLENEIPSEESIKDVEEMFKSDFNKSPKGLWDD